ncbi:MULTISPECIES: cell wall-binding protein [unclassified Clostridium]|uniref:cell wall-binding protein n=1 Tax=unclassified Clostridium TaxID=2614128 RepID=UPI0002985A69|nr:MULTISPECIES: cell wall-binding protein [unclassified Clostridium]EKQ54477.1 MAG: putative cell wall binding protein [Clostridium sp. Maddingley MBC34-26]
MKRQNLKRTIAIGVIAASILSINPITASAEWKEDSNGWWNSEGNSWSVGWKNINGQWYYFDSNGYMKTGWIQYNDKWYYLYNSGVMAKSTIINGYELDSNGAWIQNATHNSEQDISMQNSLSNVNSNATTIGEVTGIKLNDITKIVFYDGRGGLNKPIVVEDRQKLNEFIGYLNDYTIKKTKNPEMIGWALKAIFYINDKEVINITFDDPININNEYFKIMQGDLDTNKIDEYLKSIDPSHLTIDELNKKAAELNK